MSDHSSTTLPQATVTALRPVEVVAMAVISALMIAATAFHAWSITWVEVAGFVTGGICVWLTVRENVWNWPLGLVNNIAFFVLFFHARLFADAGLQIVYLLIGAFGWWNWVHGGAGRTALTISRTPARQWLILLAVVPLATLGLRQVLIAMDGASPDWDALTTVLSLAAQYMLSRKQLEHWYFWILADLVYIPLYLSRGLTLTAVLYLIFLVMCFIGLRAWRQRLQEGALARP